MLILKIIVIWSAVLNIGHAATQCDSDQIVEFVCQDPTCMLTVEDGYSEGQYYNKQKQLVTIIGYNNNTFLVRNNKGIMSIVPKNQLKVKVFAKIEHWKYTVNINKNTFEVCEQSNPNNGENIDIAKAAQINSDTDEKIDKTNDGIKIPEVIEDANIKIVEEENNERYEKVNNETDPIVSSFQKELIDDELNESIEIESEDELTLDTNFVDKSLKEELRLAENQVDKIISDNNDNVSNFDFVDNKKTDLNGKINQNNILKPTIPPKLENDSSTECTLDSCAKDTYSEEKNLNKNIDSEKLSPISPSVNVHSDHQQKNDNPPSTQQLKSLEETNNLTIEPPNNTTLPTSDMGSLQENISGMDNLNVEFSHQQQNEPVLINKKSPNVENTDDSVKPKNPASQIPSTIDLQNNNIEEVNETLQENLNQNISLQEQYEKVPTNQQSQSVEKTGDFEEKSTNPEPLSPSTITLQNSNNIEEVNETQPENLNVIISKDELSPNLQQSPSLEKTDDFVKEPKNPDPHNPSIIALENNDNIIKEEKEIHQETTYDNPLKDIPEEIGQQSNNNFIELQLLNVNNDMKETNNNLPTESNSLEKPESQNSNEDNITETSNNDSVDNILTHPSPVKEIMNETNTVSSSDYQTTVSDEKIDVPEMLNTNSINKCTSESGCSHSMDSIPQYPYESLQPQYKPEKKVISYENTHNNIEPINNEKSKDFEPQSFVASFGHPDSCSGINCLKFKRNVEKTIKTPEPLNPVLKQEDLEATSHITNNGLEKETNNIVNDITEQKYEELSLLDTLQNWISSPTLNSIDFLWNIFGDYSNAYNDVYPDIVNNQKIVEQGKLVSHSELYFIVMAVVTLLFSLIYYKYQKGTYENQLLTLLAAKDQSLLIVEKELSLLKEQSCGNTPSATEKNDEIETLNEKLYKSEDIISSQAIRIEKLEQEVEELTESGMEMHKLLNSALQSSSKNSSNLKTLKVKLVDAENLVAALTQKNFDKTTELERKSDVLKNLQITVDELTHKNTNLVEENEKISSQLEQVITKNMLKESKLLGEINSLKFELDRQTNALITAENEVSQSKESIQEIMSQKCNPADAKKFLSAVKLSAELKSVKQICEGYKQKLDESLKSNQQHLDHIDVLKNEKTNIEGIVLKLEKKNEEFENKLHILTKYFKEQEKEYLKQINEKVILCENQEGESTDLQERINYLKQEITNYKSEIQSLKKEITDQEASFKIQISAADKKASDHWISFRQAERKLKEMELETAQLRNKLTMVDKKLENGTKSIDSSKDFDDELLDIPLPTESPEFILLDFEPPPPILTNERLPPLGALGQASSPPVPLSRRHNRSLSPSSPPPIQRSSVFRPLPQRYNYMNRQNSLGHSAESLDK